VWREELDGEFASFAEQLQSSGDVETYSVEDIGAPIASGRLPTRGMLIVPCSMDALAALAQGRSANLLERAADVTLKEGRRLVLVPRESPLSAVHLGNMLSLARLGVRIVPPMPAFYRKPRTVEEVVDEVVERALRALGLPEVAGQ